MVESVAGPHLSLAGLRFAFADEPAAAIARFVLAELGARIDDGGAPALRLPAHGARGRFAAAPVRESAVNAVCGALMAQWTYRPGPAYLVTPYASTGQGLLAAAGALANALGPSCMDAVSMEQGILAVEAGAFAFGARPDRERWLKTPRGQWATYSTFLAADDWLFVGASTTPFMLKVLDLVGLDDLLADARIVEGTQSAFRDAAFTEEVRARIQDVIATRPRDAWLRLCAQERVPAGPVLSLEDALRQPHLQAAGLATPDGELRAPVRVERRGAGAARWQSERDRPLDGLRVVELAGYIAGSYAGRLLADLGADVIKVEPPGGDPFRLLGYGFVAWNHGKRSLALDLRAAADRARLLELVRRADVLVTNYRPEALDRMGVGREALFAVNPTLTHCTLAAFGETGPLAHLPGFDPVVQAFAGIMKRQGGDGEPVKPQIAATDYLCGMLGAIGVLAALLQQRTEGGGYQVTTSLLAAALLLNHDAYASLRAGLPLLIGGRDFLGPDPFERLYACADGWLLTAGTPAARQPAERYLAQERLPDSVEAALARLGALGVPAAPCLDPEALPYDEHFAANALLLRVEQPGLGPITFPAPVLSSNRDALPAPALGAHNDTGGFG